MREEGLAEDTRKVYGTLTDYLRRHNQGTVNGPWASPYIRSLDTRTDLTYILVSGYIPCSRTERRPW
jgi:hypothetical protein